jgi:AraC-like DNA-binding protein
MNYIVDYLEGATPPHKHANYEIIIYTKHTHTLHFLNGDFLVGPGQIAIIPPGTVHYSTSDYPDFGQIYVRGNFDQFFSLTSPVVVSDDNEKEALRLAKIIYQNRHIDPGYVDILQQALIHHLLRNIEIEDKITAATRKIAEYISTHFHDSNINLHTLLESSGYAEDYIRSEFKKSTGKTPTEFLTEIRITHACYLIDIYKKHIPLSDIAERCGYTDYIYFSRRFKHITGISPRQYLESGKKADCDATK